MTLNILSLTHGTEDLKIRILNLELFRIVAVKKIAMKRKLTFAMGNGGLE